MGWECGSDVVRYLLKNFNIVSEGKIILKSIFIFKNVKCSVNENIQWLFERHIYSILSNNIILKRVMAVTSGKFFDRETEYPHFIRLFFYSN